jgi:hypothetical protein
MTNTTQVVFTVGWSPSEADYQKLMFTDPKGWSIKNKVFGQLPKDLPYLITKWNNDVVSEIKPSFQLAIWSLLDLVLVVKSQLKYVLH